MEVDVEVDVEGRLGGLAEASRMTPQSGHCSEPDCDAGREILPQQAYYGDEAIVRRPENQSEMDILFE